MANLYSATLDGATDAFSAADHADFKPTGAFTVGAWVNVTSNADYRTIFQSEAHGSSSYAGFRIDITNGHKPRLLSGKNTGEVVGTDVQVVVGDTTVDDGVWHWVVGVWDESKLYMYVDGESDATAVTWANAPVYQATNYVRVGCANTTGSNGFWLPANVDEVFLINGSAWGASKVGSMYKSFLTGETNLKAYYQLENGNTDSSGNSQDLTSIGTPTFTSEVPFFDVTFGMPFISL